MVDKIKALIICVLAFGVLVLSETVGTYGAVYASIFLGSTLLNPILAMLFSIVIAYVIFRLLLVNLLKYDFREMRIHKMSIKWYWILTGLFLIVFVFGVFLTLSGKFVACKADVRTDIILTSIFSDGLLPGIIEEFCFRGVCMGVLEKHFNKYVAVLLPSIGFATVHLMGRSISPLSTVQLILSGTLVAVMFSLITLESGSIWNSAIIHSAWDMVQGFLVVATAAQSRALYTYVLNTKNMLITGGDYGFDCSIIPNIGYILVIILALILIHRKSSKLSKNNM